MKFLDQIINEISASSDRIMQVINEGTSILLEPSSMTTNSPISDDKLEIPYSPLGDIANSFMDEVMQGQVGPKNTWENLQAFRAAINWTEPFILSLLFFQIFTLFICYHIRKYGGTTSRLILLAVIAIIVRSMEWMNKKCQIQWHRFATQNYFDPQGIFVSIFITCPLMIYALSMLVSYILEARQLIRELQKLKLQGYKTKNASKNTVLKKPPPKDGIKHE